jgi:hypothetical protein
MYRFAAQSSCIRFCSPPKLYDNLSRFIESTFAVRAPLNLCAFASLADVDKGGDGAKSALREIFSRVSGQWILSSVFG